LGDAVAVHLAEHHRHVVGALARRGPIAKHVLRGELEALAALAIEQERLQELVPGGLIVGRDLEHQVDDGQAARHRHERTLAPFTRPVKHVLVRAMSGNGSNGKGQHLPKVALVTGASGFIGSHVVRILVDEGVKVRALVQQGVPLANLDDLPVERVVGDLLDGHSLERALEGCDTLFHLAAIFAYWLPDPSLMYRVNVEGTVRLMRAALGQGVKKVVHPSSIAAIGIAPGTDGADEDTAFNSWDTADHYVLSKYMGELEALRFNHLGLPVVAVNPAFPYGANDIAPTPTG